MINIRLYTSGDASKIYDLLSKETSHRRDAEFWIWINRLISVYPSIIGVAENKNEIVGHYAILPITLVLSDGSTISAGLGMHAIVSANFRDKVSIYSISNLVYERAKSLGIDVVIGFPNSQYRLIQEKIERWKCISLFKVYEKRIFNTRNKVFHYKWKNVDIPTGEDLIMLDDLILNCIVRGHHVKKDLNFYINRYIQHPHKLYQCWLLKEHDECIAFVVTKKFSKDDSNYYHIVDFVYSDMINLKSLILDFQLIMSDEEFISVQWPVNKDFTRALNEIGYTQSGYDTYFGIKFLSEKSLRFKNTLLDIENWFLPIGTSDAY